jgi:hypothetical protein
MYSVLWASEKFSLWALISLLSSGDFVSSDHFNSLNQMISKIRIFFFSSYPWHLGHNISNSLLDFFFFGGTRVWTQNFRLARYVLYHLRHISSPCWKSYWQLMVTLFKTGSTSWFLHLGNCYHPSVTVILCLFLILAHNLSCYILFRLWFLSLLNSFSFLGV